MALVLHIWAAPASSNVPSLDPNCVAAILALQLTVPGQFTVQACSTPDTSPSGTLPYLTHGHRAVPGLSAIVKYVAGSGLGANADLDGHLSKSEKARNTAWVAHVESQLGALVAHELFVLPENWKHLMHPALVAPLSIPQRYYVPHRIRESYQPRLEAMGLWVLPEAEEPAAELKSFAERQVKAKQSLSPQQFKKTFSRQKVFEQARSVLDVYVSLLHDRTFCLGDKPALVDVLLAAHILVLTGPHYPDPLLQTLLSDSYPRLFEHARHIQSLALGDSSALPRASAAPRLPLTSLLPWPRWSTAADPLAELPEWQAVERRFAIQRWTWIAAAVTSTVGYLAYVRMHRILAELARESR